MNFAGKVVEFAYKRRIIVGFCVALLFASTFLLITRAKFEENIYDILPFEDDIVLSHIYAAEKFKQSNTLYLNVSGAEGKEAAAWLASALRGADIFSEVFPNSKAFTSPDALENILQILPFIFTESAALEMQSRISQKGIEERLDSFLKNLHSMNSFGGKFFLKNDPMGTFFIFSEKAKILADSSDFAKFSGDSISSKDGKNFLILAEASFDSSDSEKSAILMESVLKITKNFKNKFPNAELAIAGGYRVSAENAAMAKRDSKFCVSLTLILLAFICALSFRNKFYALAAIFPSLFGTAVAFCVLILYAHKISSIAIAFASIAIGVSMDYAVHILYRLDNRKKVSLKLAKETATHLAKPIFITSGTSAIAFVVIYFSGASGFKQLGIFGALGISFSALASLAFLPAFAVGSASGKKSFFGFFARLGSFLEKILGRLGKFSALFLILAISFAAIPFALNLEFDGKVSSLSGLSKEAKIDDKKIKEAWSDGLSQKIIIARGSNFSDARKANEKLGEFLKSENNLQISDTFSLLPSDEKALENAKRWENFWLKNYDLASENLKNAAEKKGVNFAVISANLGRLKQNPNFANFQDNKLFKIFKGRVSDDSQAIANFIKVPENFDKKAFIKKLSQVSENLSYIDTEYLGEHIAHASLKWMIAFGMAALALVSLYLFIILKRVREVAGILAPVCVGMLWSFALMQFLGVNVNIVNAIFVIFAVCIAQDYAVFLRYSSSAKEDKSASIAVVLISASTTMAAFGSLAMAEHPVLKTLGLAASISIFSILCACLIFSCGKIFLKSER